MELTTTLFCIKKIVIDMFVSYILVVDVSEYL